MRSHLWGIVREDLYEKVTSCATRILRGLLHLQKEHDSRIGGKVEMMEGLEVRTHANKPTKITVTTWAPECQSYTTYSSGIAQCKSFQIRVASPKVAV